MGIKINKEANELYITLSLQKKEISKSTVVLKKRGETLLHRMAS